MVLLRNNSAVDWLGDCVDEATVVLITGLVSAPAAFLAAGGAFAAARAAREAARITTQAQHEQWVRQMRQDAYAPALSAIWRTERALSSLLHTVRHSGAVAHSNVLRHAGESVHSAETRVDECLNAVEATLAGIAAGGSAQAAAAAEQALAQLRKAAYDLSEAVYLLDAGTWPEGALHDRCISELTEELENAALVTKAFIKAARHEMDGLGSFSAEGSGRLSVRPG